MDTLYRIASKFIAQINFKMLKKNKVEQSNTRNYKSSALNILHLTSNTPKLSGYNTLAVNVTFACRKAVTIDALSNLQYSQPRKNLLGIVRENGITSISYYEQIIRVFYHKKIKLLLNFSCIKKKIFLDTVVEIQCHTA